MRQHLDRRRGDDAGFTLIETLVAVVIVSVMLGMAVTGFRRYAMAARHKGTVQEIVALLRDTQVRAVSEARTYCVRFSTNGRTYRLHRGTCTSGPMIEGPFETQARVRFTNVAFTQPSGLVGREVYFYARGSASGGSLEVRRSGSNKEFVITVEGLTARVSSNV